MMPDVLQLGPLQLQGKLVAMLLACALGIWLIRRAARLSREQKEQVQGDSLEAKSIDDIVFNGGIIVLLTWKFGVIISQPSLLWTSPLKLLMVTGSSTEIAWGALLAGVYMYYQLRKHRIPLYYFLDLCVVGVTASIFLYCALIPAYGMPTKLPWGVSVHGAVSRYHPYLAYAALLLAPYLVWQVVFAVRRVNFGRGLVWKYSLIYGGAAGMLASFFAATRPVLFYLSLWQLIFLFMLVVGMLLPALAHNTGRRELSAMSQNDSKTQIQQEQQNQEREKNTSSGKEGFVDKKLDGPNRPST